MMAGNAPLHVPLLLISCEHILYVGYSDNFLPLNHNMAWLSSDWLDLKFVIQNFFTSACQTSVQTSSLVTIRRCEGVKSVFQTPGQIKGHRKEFRWFLKTRKQNWWIPFIFPSGIGNWQAEGWGLVDIVAFWNNGNSTRKYPHLTQYFWCSRTCPCRQITKEERCQAAVNVDMNHAVNDRYKLSVCF